MVLAEGPHRQDAMTLLVDVGTNAEIVLGNRDRLLAASSPTGPAFEGAQISSGQRAAPGAVERVRIDRETLEPATAETRAICERLRERGVIVQPTSDRQCVLKIKPPLCLGQEGAGYFADMLAKVLEEGW